MAGTRLPCHGRIWTWKSSSSPLGLSTRSMAVPSTWRLVRRRLSSPRQARIAQPMWWVSTRVTTMRRRTLWSNASCTTNGMASVCKVLDESFGVEYGMMTTTHSYTGDQMILDGRHRDLRRARAGACNIVPTSTGAAKAVAEVLPQFKGKLNGIALRVPTPNVSVVDLVLKVSKKTSAEEVNAAIKAAADGACKGIINFETQPLVSSDFMQTDYSNSVDAALTMVMGEDLVKVVMWYDNEWGYSQRVIDHTAIVAAKMPVAA